MGVGMKITLVAVGKVKERYFTEAAAEYVKRISRYAKVEVLEVADEKTPDQAPEGEKSRILEKEGERILQKIPAGAFVVALAIEGKMPDSKELAEQMERWNVEGVSHVVFVIGGSLGLAGKVMKRANYVLSFSRMTFPHQLMRVILLEQIYRSFTIRNHTPYHK